MHLCIHTTFYNHARKLNPKVFSPLPLRAKPTACNTTESLAEIMVVIQLANKFECNTERGAVPILHKLLRFLNCSFSTNCRDLPKAKFISQCASNMFNPTCSNKLSAPNWTSSNALQYTDIRYIYNLFPRRCQTGMPQTLLRKKTPISQASPRTFGRCLSTQSMALMKQTIRQL